MSTTPWIKLTAFGMVVWVVFGVQLSVQTGAAMGVAAGFLVLLMLLDAAQSERLGEEERGRLGEAETGRQAVVRMLRRLMSRSVAPFYLALGLLGWLGLRTERQGDWKKGRWGDWGMARGWRPLVGGARRWVQRMNRVKAGSAPVGSRWGMTRSLLPQSRRRKSPNGRRPFKSER